MVVPPVAAAVQQAISAPPDEGYFPESELGERVLTILDQAHENPSRNLDEEFFRLFLDLRLAGGDDYTHLVRHYRAQNPCLLDLCDIRATEIETLCGLPSQTLIAHGLTQFVNLELPEKEFLIERLLETQGLAMVYAPRGIGKTWFSLNLAYAVATGGKYLKWEAPKPRKVLYLDGEMPAVTMQERLASIIDADDRDGLLSELYGNLIIVSQEQQQPCMPDLSTLEGQHVFEQYTREVDLIVVDNISTLCRSGAENKSDDWNVVSEWALRMRAQGRSVLFVHHAGKGGAQRGTSKREDTLDLVLALRKPASDELNGASFEVRFEKHRGLFGEDIKPFVSSLSNGKWTLETIEDNTYRQIVALAETGLSQVEIAEEIGKHKSTVSRHLARAKATGELSK